LKRSFAGFVKCKRMLNFKIARALKLLVYALIDVSQNALR
jgi:hypothetical protein